MTPTTHTGDFPADLTGDVNRLNATLAGDPTALTPGAADAAIGPWERVVALLPGVLSVPGQAIGADLAELRRQATSPAPDGQAIGRLLESLSTRTTAVASQQSGPLEMALKALAATLHKASATLTRG